MTNIRDINTMAAHIVARATGMDPPAAPKAKAKPKAAPKKKNPAAVALGRLGGLKGGKARAASLTAKQRSEIAKKAATKRWKSKQ